MVDVNFRPESRFHTGRPEVWSPGARYIWTPLTRLPPAPWASLVSKSGVPSGNQWKMREKMPWNGFLSGCPSFRNTVIWDEMGMVQTYSRMWYPKRLWLISKNAQYKVWCTKGWHSNIPDTQNISKHPKTLGHPKDRSARWQALLPQNPRKYISNFASQLLLSSEMKLWFKFKH